MSRRIELPTEQHVRDVLAQMLAEAAASGARPSVLALARRLNLSNTAFWRHYRDIATEVRHMTRAGETPADGQIPRPDRGGELTAENARLRLERDRLAGQLEAALGHIRRLTIDNARLRRDMEAAHGIASLDPGRTAPQRR